MLSRLSLLVVLLSQLAFAAEPDVERKDSISQLSKAKAGAGDWVWIPRDDTFCRDGSTAGFGARLLPDAKAVMIYLQGGGACYDAQSCAENKNAPIAGENYSREKFQEWVDMLGNQGVFNTTNPSNPVARWNHIYIPYCTGDLHGGARTDVDVPGVTGKQQFVGYRNIENDLKVLAPYFRGAEDVALVGASAGGFGVLINYPQVVEAFAGRSVAALVDSAPIIPESSIKTLCFEQKLIDTFQLQLPERCPQCSQSAVLSVPIQRQAG